jgi:hypothetical protein
MTGTKKTAEAVFYFSNNPMFTYSPYLLPLIYRGSEIQGLNSIYPGGVNICEHLELLGETDREERVKRPSHTDGRFRATCLSMSHLQCDIRVWPGPL